MRSFYLRSHVEPLTRYTHSVGPRLPETWDRKISWREFRLLKDNTSKTLWL